MICKAFIVFKASYRIQYLARRRQITHGIGPCRKSNCGKQPAVLAVSKQSPYHIHRKRLYSEKVFTTRIPKLRITCNSNTGWMAYGSRRVQSKTYIDFRITATSCWSNWLFEFGSDNVE